MTPWDMAGLSARFLSSFHLVLLKHQVLPWLFKTIPLVASFPLHSWNQIKNKFLFSLRLKLMEQLFSCILMIGGTWFGGLIRRGNATLCTVLELCRLELLLGKHPD